MKLKFEEQQAKSGDSARIDFVNYLSVKEKMTPELFRAQPGFRMLAGLQALVHQRAKDEWDDDDLRAWFAAHRERWRQTEGVKLSLIAIPFQREPGQGGTPVVTAEQLAREARDRLVLSRPVVHRSPVETNDYQGEPFTWVNLWTWFWTDAGTYQPLTQTVSAGPVSATVVATPVGLLFDPGDGGDAVRCPGPGRPWTDADSNAAPVSGCGYQYRHVSDLAVTSRLGILWRVTWTGTGGTGGTLPTMETITDAPLRVLQVQVVNR